ncbi:unnamed protein product [Lepeophtheirus salmonis]|uniref:(salmon louse) hypothetical protein n=1 Tax=Lepeophtheirus salmonis TaxID=72036 RepID=A0A7R8CPK1_LEPSM|nr:unnamed protein product [Lepeophtheirus salmonis]CAF2886946.1 unnamed protein product [Lepeophtheirus salmonis]
MTIQARDRDIDRHNEKVNMYKIRVEELKRQAGIERILVSEACDDIKDYITTKYAVRPLTDKEKRAKPSHLLQLQETNLQILNDNECIKYGEYFDENGVLFEINPRTELCAARIQKRLTPERWSKDFKTDIQGSCHYFNGRVRCLPRRLWKSFMEVDGKESEEGFSRRDQNELVEDLVTAIVAVVPDLGEKRHRHRAESPPRTPVDESAAWDREREKKKEGKTASILGSCFTTSHSFFGKRNGWEDPRGIRND